MWWWGQPWPSAELRAPICDDDSRSMVPVGERCMHCDELIAADDQGVTIPGYVDSDNGPRPAMFHAHRECHLFAVVSCSTHFARDDLSYREQARRFQRSWTVSGATG